jgi:hypothetical protein
MESAAAPHSKAASRPRALDAKRLRVRRDSATLAVKQPLSTNLKNSVSHINMRNSHFELSISRGLTHVKSE